LYAVIPVTINFDQLTVYR